MASRASPAPSLVQQALNLRASVETRYSQRNQMMKDMRQRRHQQRRVPIARAYRSTTREVRLPLLADTVDLMVAILDDAPIRAHVEPPAPGPVASRNAGLRERWSEAFLEQLQEDAQRQVLTCATGNQVGDGLGVLKLAYRPEHWRELPTARSLFGRKEGELDEEHLRELDKRQEEAKKGTQLPFKLLDVDPITYHPIYGPDSELDAVLEISERPVHDLLLRYRTQIGLNRQGHVVPLALLGEAYPIAAEVTPHQGTVQFWEYWDREHAITFVDDIPVHYSRHKMGAVPYFDFAARPSPSRDPEIRYRPSVYKQIWILDLLDSFWTQMSNAGYLYGFPTPVTTTAAGAGVPLGDDGKPDAVRYEPGRHMILWEGQTFTFITPPSEHLEVMERLIQQGLRLFDQSSGLGPSIRGQGGSDQPGYAINQLIQASLLSLRPATKSRDWAISRAVKHAWRTIERRLEDEVWVYGTDPTDKSRRERKWLKLGPSDIAGYYRLRIESKPLIDQLRIAKGQFGASMVKAQLLDRRTVIQDFLGYEDPDGLIDAIEVDKAMSEGRLHDYMVYTALKRAGLIPPQPPPPPATPPGVLPGGGMVDQFGQPMGGGVTSQPGVPNALPPQPGEGMPLAPGAPPAPQPTGGQIAELGSWAMPPGRAAGADRAGPMIQPRPIQPE